MGKVEILKEIDDRLSEVDVYSEEIDEELVKLGELYAKEGQKRREKRIKELLAKGEYLTYTEALELHGMGVEKRKIMTAMGVERWRWKYVRFDTSEKFYRGLIADKDELQRQHPRIVSAPKLSKEERKIARKNGISDSTLHRRLKEGWSVKAAITESPFRRRSWTKEMDKKLISLVKAGKNNKQIGEIMERTPAAISYRRTQLRKRGLLV